MTILNRYITREFLKVFFLSLSAFVVIYLIVDILENINQFLKKDVPPSSIIEFFVFKIPPIIVQVTPVATLLSSIITLGILSRNSELIAIMASGINIYRIIVPIVGFSFLVSVVSFMGNESIVPYTNQRVKHIENTELKKKKPLISFKQNRIWYRSNNAIYNIDLFDPTQNILRGIAIFYFNREFNLNHRIDARMAKWIDKEWHFFKVSSRIFDNGKEIKMEKWDKKIIPLPEVADDFKFAEKSADEMSYKDLKSYVNKIKAEGYDATKYLVDLHAKLAFPFASLIMSLIGIPFALKTGREKGIISGVGISILISFGYWIMFSLTLSFGHGGVLPPIVSAWISNFTFLTIGIVMLLNVR